MQNPKQPSISVNRAKLFEEGCVDAYTFNNSGYGPAKPNNKYYMQGWECGLNMLFELKLLAVTGHAQNGN